MSEGELFVSSYSVLGCNRDLLGLGELSMAFVGQMPGPVQLG